MIMKSFVFCASIVCITGITDNAYTCDLDKKSETQESKSLPDTTNQNVIDSLHVATREFRAKQNKKIVELRVKIDSELNKITLDKILIKRYVDEQAAIRVSIEKKWLDHLYKLKSLVSPVEFINQVKGNWGCGCGDADCSCVPVRNVQNPESAAAKAIVFDSEKVTKKSEKLKNEIIMYRQQMEMQVRKLRSSIDEELCSDHTDRKRIDQYVAEQSTLRTALETKWLEALWELKSDVNQNQFETLVTQSWGCESAIADCACVKK